MHSPGTFQDKSIADLLQILADEPLPKKLAPVIGNLQEHERRIIETIIEAHNA
jgi:hypothetical protein